MKTPLVISKDGHGVIEHTICVGSDEKKGGHLGY